MTVLLNPQGRYRGPGPDPKKNRVPREAELMGMMSSADGRDIILALFQEARGIPFGTCVQVGTLMRGEMIPCILDKEYPTT
ncbi:MAG: hypothetical protein L0Y72_10390 [Gemmataceae bacterium]|nr:hypothetical protein [Gemmataceae bacterium]MCI0739442.1 hypothetical protein [Gemmataceae bacterium]